MKKAGYLFGLLMLSGSAWAQVSVSDGYVRATPPMGPNTAAFMVLTNEGTTARQLLAVRSAAADKAELHTVLNQDGVMQMRQLEQGISLPAGASVVLQPGGMHIMLLGVNAPLTDGDEVSLELEWADGEHQSVMLPVKDIRSPAAHHGHEEHHDEGMHDGQQHHHQQN